MAIEVFSTCPQVSFVPREQYLQTVADVAKWSDQNGCKGILVYTDNSQADPWLIAQIIIQNTRQLCPLVAVQPAYMHPYSVAKNVATLGHLYGRKIYLNMVAGGFKNDLAALDDTTPHDRRYDRLIEYTTIIKLLLDTAAPVTFAGEFYKVDKLKMTPPLAKELFPGIFMSGSSEAGLNASRVVGGTAIKYPKPVRECANEPLDVGLKSGIRVGIIARTTEEEAWKVAEELFPEDRKGQIAHHLAMKVSDSSWHQQLSEMAVAMKETRDPYWLVPFENYKTFCPYLVGSYQRVSEEIARYIALGFRTFILDIPPSEAELRHSGIVFERASRIQIAA